MFGLGRRRKNEQAESVNPEIGVASVDRRNMLRISGAAAAAGAAAAVISGAATASPAAAGVDGDLTLGSVGNTATTPTGLSVNASQQDYGIGVTDNAYGGALEQSALFGHAKGTAFNVAGFLKGEQLAGGLNIETENGLGLHVSTASAIAAKFGSAMGPVMEVATQGTNGQHALSVFGGGDGSRIVAQGQSVLNPVIAAEAYSAQPALKATGNAVTVSPSVPIAGHAAALAVRGVASFTRSGVVTLATAGA